MSITTTREIKKDLLLEAIYNKLDSATNEELASVLEVLVNNEFYNFRVVEEFSNPTKYEIDGEIFEFYMPRIEELSDLPNEKYSQYKNNY